MGKIKVIRVITRLNIGGPAIHTILLNSRLPKDKFTSLLVTGVEAKHEGNMLDLAKAKSVKPVIIPQLGREINLTRDLVTFRKIFKLIKEEKPQIVHTHTSKAGMLGRLAAKLAGVPVIIHTFHGHVFHSYFSPLKTRLFISVERFLAHFTNRIIAISSRQKDEIVSYKIAKPDKIEVIPLGFELQPFLSTSKSVGESFRKKLGLKKDEKLVGIVGRLAPVKNHHFFFQAAKQVAEKLSNVKFVVVGDGELRSELEKQVEELGLKEKIIFTGWLRDMPAVYAATDVVSLTSLNEGTPVTLIEAMASGCPVVATNVGGVADLITPGENGFLVNSFKKNEFAKYLINLLNDPVKAEKIGGKGRQKVEKLFAVERLVNEMSQLYLKLLKEKGITA